MGKKKIIYQETYNKGVVATNKQQIIDLINDKNTTIIMVKAGRYVDGKQFITITIDNFE